MAGPEDYGKFPVGTHVTIKTRMFGLPSKFGIVDRIEMPFIFVKVVGYPHILELYPDEIDRTDFVADFDDQLKEDERIKLAKEAARNEKV